MTLVLDSGALVALERSDRFTWSLLTGGLRKREPVVTHGGVVAQVWRGGSGRQFGLARTLRSIAVAPLDDALGRAAGELMAASGTTDGIDAAVVAMASEGDRILTSDPYDLQELVSASGRPIDVIPV